MTFLKSEQSMRNSIIKLTCQIGTCLLMAFVAIPTSAFSQSVKKDTLNRFAETYLKVNLLSPAYTMRQYMEIGAQHRIAPEFGMGLSIVRYFNSQLSTKRDGESYNGLAGRMEIFYHQPSYDLGLAFSIHKIVNKTFHPVLRREATYLQNMLLNRHVFIRDYQVILNWRWNILNHKNIFLELYTRCGIQHVFVGYELPEDGFLHSESTWVKQDAQDERMFNPGERFYGSFDIGIRIAFGW